jgi:hypothetical protein
MCFKTILVRIGHLFVFLSVHHACFARLDGRTSLQTVLYRIQRPQNLVRELPSLDSVDPQLTSRPEEWPSLPAVP